jgi:hypothetical protein
MRILWMIWEELKNSMCFKKKNRIWDMNASKWPHYNNLKFSYSSFSAIWRSSCDSIFSLRFLSLFFFLFAFYSSDSDACTIFISLSLFNYDCFLSDSKFIKLELSWIFDSIYEMLILKLWDWYNKRWWEALVWSV